MAAPSGATAVLREAAAAMRESEGGGVFLYAVMSMLENRAERLEATLPKFIDPATPERVFADVYKVARAYLQEVGEPSDCGHERHRDSLMCQAESRDDCDRADHWTRNG